MSVFFSGKVRLFVKKEKKNKPYKRQKNKTLTLNSGIQTYQILTNDDEVCIPSLSSILLAVFNLKLSEREKTGMLGLCL